MRDHTGPPVWPAEWFHNRAAEARDSNWLWGAKGTWTWGCVWAQALHWTSVCCRHEPRGYTDPTCFSIPTSLGQRSQWREREKHTLKGNRASSGPNFIVSAATTWYQTPLLIGQWWPLRRRKSYFTLGSISRPCISSPTFYEGGSCRYTLRKDMTSSTSKSNLALPPNTLVTPHKVCIMMHWWNITPSRL